MNPADEFLRHAADCQQMAKFTRDPASKESSTARPSRASRGPLQGQRAA